MEMIRFLPLNEKIHVFSSKSCQGRTTGLIHTNQKPVISPFVVVGSQSDEAGAATEQVTAGTASHCGAEAVCKQ